MSQSFEAEAPDPALLPDEEHTLVHISKLEHGEYNPRRVRPKDSLKRSVNNSGINQPLIVRPDPEDDLYHITDGWQRYQAALDAGWELLPVKICETTVEALDQTGLASIGRREWSPYEWARFSRSVANEVQGEDDSKMDVVHRVVNVIDRGPTTVRQYLNVMSLPEVIHPLLTTGPDGSAQQWAQLQNYNEDVRQYSGLTLQVADRLATQQSAVCSDDRLIGIAAHAVEFSDSEDAIEFIELAVEEDEKRLERVQREVLVGSDHSEYLIAPQTAVKLSSEKKQAVIEDCHQKRRSISDIVTEAITSLADELTEADRSDSDE